MNTKMNSININENNSINKDSSVGIFHKNYPISVLVVILSLNILLIVFLCSLSIYNRL